MGTELMREGMGRRPLLQAGTINRLLLLSKTPVCSQRGHEPNQPLQGPWAPARPAQLETTVSAEWRPWPMC